MPSKSQASASNPLRRIFRLQFFSETYGELRKAVWPSRQELIRLTLMVLSISVAVGLFLGAIDYGLAYVAKVALQ